MDSKYRIAKGLGQEDFYSRHRGSNNFVCWTNLAALHFQRRIDFKIFTLNAKPDTVVTRQMWRNACTQANR